MRIRDNIVRMYAMMTGQTQEQITEVKGGQSIHRRTNDALVCFSIPFGTVD